MGTSRNWFKLIHRKFVRTSTRDIVVVPTNISSNPHEEIPDDFQDPNTATATPHKKQVLTKQDIAAIKIQAFFRGHLVLIPQLLFIIVIQMSFLKLVLAYKNSTSLYWLLWWFLIWQARRAFRALRSLVKLQALVRGVCVRRQSRIALHCMHSLVRLQVSVRARQLLSRSGDRLSTKSLDIFNRYPHN